MNRRLMQDFCGGLSDLLNDSARRAEVREENKRLHEKLNEAIERMEMARNILTGGAPTPERNWGMLDTADLRPNAVLSGGQKGPSASNT